MVLYRHKRLRSHQFFCFPNWTGGLYVTPTIAGSRPGALSAACWAAMVKIGQEGYEARAKAILETTRLIAEGVKTIPGLVLQGQVGCATPDSGDQIVRSFPHTLTNSTPKTGGGHDRLRGRGGRRERVRGGGPDGQEGVEPQLPPVAARDSPLRDVAARGPARGVFEGSGGGQSRSGLLWCRWKCAD